MSLKISHFFNISKAASEKLLFFRFTVLFLLLWLCWTVGLQDTWSFLCFFVLALLIWYSLYRDGRKIWEFRSYYRYLRAQKDDFWALLEAKSLQYESNGSKTEIQDINREITEYKTKNQLSLEEKFFEMLINISYEEKKFITSSAFDFSITKYYYIRSAILSLLLSFLMILSVIILLTVITKIQGSEMLDFSFTLKDLQEWSFVILIFGIVFFFLFFIFWHKFVLKWELLQDELLTKNEFFKKIFEIAKQYFSSQNNLQNLWAKNILLYGAIIEIFWKNIFERQKLIDFLEKHRKKYFRICFFRKSIPEIETMFFIQQKKQLQEDSIWVQKVISYWAQKELSQKNMISWNNAEIQLVSARRKIYVQSLENISRQIQ